METQVRKEDTHSLQHSLRCVWFRLMCMRGDYHDTLSQGCPYDMRVFFLVQDCNGLSSNIFHLEDS